MAEPEFDPHQNTAIAFEAAFFKATTTADGGWRISFDLPETESKTVSILAALKGRYLQVAVVPVEDQ